MRISIAEIIRSGAGSLVDVRSQGEFQSGHLPGAIHIPLDEVQAKMKEIAALPQPIILYCHSGHRSGIAADYLQQQGVEEVFNGGGIFQLMHLVHPSTE
jgi:rhodanese-related sulfurtransferase